MQIETHPPVHIAENSLPAKMSSPDFSLMFYNEDVWTELFSICLPALFQQYFLGMQLFTQR